MKFTVTNIIDVAAALTAEAFADLTTGCPSVVVDIRNPSATVANLKAAAAVKLKAKDTASLRLVAVFGEGGADKDRNARVLDELEAERKAVLTAVFGGASATASASADGTVHLYALRAADASTAVLDAIAAAGNVSVGGSSSSATAAAPAATSVAAPAADAAAPADAAAGEAAEASTSSAGGVKRDRGEGADDGDRSALASPTSKSNPHADPPSAAPLPVAAAAEAPAATASTTTTTPAAASGANGGELTAVRAARSTRQVVPATTADDDAEWEDTDGDDGDDDADDDDDDFEEGLEGFEEGDEWGSDDVDGIEWATGMNLDDLAGLVPELAPAERELITELTNLPNAADLIQQIIDGRAAEAMAAVQTANPRLFALIGEHGGLFTELMEDIKEMMDAGLLQGGASVVEHLRAMVAASNETEDLFGSDLDAMDGEDGDDAADGGGEGGAAGSPTGEGGSEAAAERRRQRRAQNEAAMSDAMNAFAGGASEMRPLSDLDEARITSLVELGFERSKAVAAYLRMGRNVERAANHLFESM